MQQPKPHTELIGLAYRGDMLVWQREGLPGTASGSQTDELTSVSAATLVRQSNIAAVCRDLGVLGNRNAQQMVNAGLPFFVLPQRDRESQHAVEGAEEIIQVARHMSESLVAVTHTDLQDLRNALAERERIVQHAERIATDIFALLADFSPEFAEILAEQKFAHSRAIPVLRRLTTAGALRERGPYLVARKLGIGASLDDQLIVDRLLALGRGNSPSRTLNPKRELQEALIPGLAAEHIVVLERLEALDAYILEQLGQDHAVPGSIDDLGFEPIDVAPAWRHEMQLALSTHTEPEEIARIAHDQFTARFTGTEHARDRYAAYRLARDQLAKIHPAPPPGLLAQVEYWGQVLSTDCGNYATEFHHYSAVHRALANFDPQDDDQDHADHATNDARELGPRTSSEINRILEDSEIAHAVAGTLGGDPDSEFENLHRIVTSPSNASPLALLEALGLLALILSLTRDVDATNEVLLHIDRVSGGPEQQPSIVRAPAEIARFHIVPSAREDEALIAQRAVSWEHARDTIYEPYHYYADMVSCCITKETERGFAQYEAVRAHFTEYPPGVRLNQMIELTHALVCASAGEFVRARRILDSVRKELDRDQRSAVYFVYLLIRARLDVAATKWDDILQLTSEGESISEEQSSSFRHRYFVAFLVLRGSALWATGEQAVSAAQFEQALQRAVRDRDFVVLCDVETPQFRQWLDGLDPEHPPQGVPGDVIRDLRSGPIYISRSLPELSRQQIRVLRLLTTGKPGSAIARELSVSQNTLKTHLRALYRNLEVSSRTQAVAVAEEYGLLG